MPCFHTITCTHGVAKCSKSKTLTTNYDKALEFCGLCLHRSLN